MKRSILAACLLSSCATTDEPRLVVDVSEQTLTAHTPGRMPTTIPISTAWRGTGGRPGSYRTPLGRLYVGAKKVGRFGQCMEIHGVSEDGYEQRGRYIELHESTREPGRPQSRGCVTMRDIGELYARTAVGTLIEIKK